MDHSHPRTSHRGPSTGIGRAPARPSVGTERDSLACRLREVFVKTWDLGFTAFGGLVVHYSIFHKRFVAGEHKWIDEGAYQELFTLCQGLPGPVSTKLLFCITMQYAGIVPALFGFLIWSLPSALIMYGLALGVQHVDEVLPSPVYAFLSGLNASTVGIVALAAVQLASGAVRDQVSRTLVLAGAFAGLCYTALWYYPAIMAVGGVTMSLWDGWIAAAVRRLRVRWRRAQQRPSIESEGEEAGVVAMETLPDSAGASQQRVSVRSSVVSRSADEVVNAAQLNVVGEQRAIHPISARLGLAVFFVFIGSFAVVMALRSTLSSPPRALMVFSNMYLAGTIIIGGGPIVFPLLRSYVVDPGWVSSRDFLIGLAICQALPGPNFNFAIYLGALALKDAPIGTQFFTVVAGGFLGFLGIFLPGMALVFPIRAFWPILRKKRVVMSALRGVNASAVGLVFTAVYRLWEIGYLTPDASRGQSLAREPWWVVVASLAYSESAWYGVPSAAAIVGGSVLGLGWYAVVGQRVK